MDKVLDRAWNFFGMFVMIVLLAVGILSIRSCISYDRDKTAACMAAGGTVSYNRCVVSVNRVPVDNWRK